MTKQKQNLKQYRPMSRVKKFINPNVAAAGYFTALFILYTSIVTLQ